MNFIGLIIGAISFFIIGCFHPLVIKAYYYCGVKSWKIFLVIGMVSVMGSCFLKNIYLSIAFGIIGFSCFWSIKEIIEQKKRVQQGRFPGNPKLKGTLDIHPAKESEYKAVRNLTIAAFDGIGEAFLVERLKNSPDFIPKLSLVAVKNDLIVGHILFSKISIRANDGKETISLAMAPVSVLPEFQRHGIGSALIKQGLEVAKNEGFQSVVVIGHADYYPKFGFKKASTFGLKYPSEVPDDCFMAMEFEQNSLQAGTIIYPKAFDIF